MQKVSGNFLYLTTNKLQIKIKKSLKNKEKKKLDNNDYKIPPRHQKQKRRILPFILVIICFLGAAVAGAMFASNGFNFGKDSKHNPVNQLERENKETELIKVKDKTTVLIMGVDMREDDVGRSDTMMLATIDPKLDKASLLSVPRDTRVRIAGYGFDKINAAYTYGGEPLSEKTIENLLGIDIDHYVIINTKSFVKIIDAIGGVDIDVEKRMYYEDPWDDNGGLYIDLYPGMQHMDGKTAITYVRYRDSEGDIGRIYRQQKFMEACMDKVVSPDIITKIPAVVREVIDAVETDMTFRQILELAGALKAAQQNGLATEMVPGYPLYIDGISYWMPDVEELRYAVAAGLGVSVDSSIKRRAEKTASEYNESIPQSAGEIPEYGERIGEPVRRSTNNYSRNRQEESNYNYNEPSSRENYSPRENYYSTEERNTPARNSYEERRSTDYDNRSSRTDYDDRYSVQSERDRNNYQQVDEPFEDIPTRGESTKNY